MVDFLLRVALETWSILKEASIFLLFGFVLAGRAGHGRAGQAPVAAVRNRQSQVGALGAAIGAPLPLCSCGVLPTALALRRQGATPGATVSFLISTPETGVDSISVTYALMDPIITVFRPVTAVITSIAAGLATNFSGRSESRARRADASEPPQPGAAPPTVRSSTSAFITITRITRARPTATLTSRSARPARQARQRTEAVRRPPGAPQGGSTTTPSGNSWTRPATGWCWASCCPGSSRRPCRRRCSSTR